MTHPASDRDRESGSRSVERVTEQAPERAVDPKGTDRPEVDAAAGEPAGTTPPNPDEVWPRVLELAGPRLRAMLDSMIVQQTSPKLLRLGVPAARSAMARDHLPEIVRLVQETGARSMSIQFVDLKPRPESAAGSEQPRQASNPETKPETGPEPGPADGPELGSDQSPAFDPREADRHPLVQRAAEVFGAKVTHIHPKRR